MYQHDPRHVDVLVKDLGLEHGNSVQTPAAPGAMEEEESEPVSQDQHHRYRSLVARCLFLSQDWVNVTFDVNELCQKMSNPNQQSLARLKRLAIVETQIQWGQVFEYGAMTKDDGVHGFGLGWLQGESEVISAGVLMLERHRLKAYTRKQKVIAKAAQRQSCTQQHWVRRKQRESRV